METEKNCSKCKEKLTVGDDGKTSCPKCDKKQIIKDLYEEAFFDLKEYKK